MVEKEYIKLKKKYGLPEFEVLDDEFEISTIEKTDFLLRNIRKKMCERLEYASELLAKMIQPEAASISDFYEFRCFDGADKKNIFDLYSKIMFLCRKLLELDMRHDEKADADMIKRIVKEWPGLRLKVADYLKKLETCWEKMPEADEELKGYLG